MISDRLLRDVIALLPNHDRIYESLNGQEFIAHERLCADLLAQLATGTGGDFLVEISLKLNAQITHIERVAKELVAERRLILFENGFLCIPDQYYAGCIAQIDQLCPTNLEMLVQKFHLPTEICASLISDGLSDGRIQTFHRDCWLHHSILMTKERYAEMNDQVHSYLSQQKRPIFIKDMEISEEYKKMAQTVIETSSLPGFWTGDLWTPRDYQRQQEESIQNSWKTADYFFYDDLSSKFKINPTNRRQYLSKLIGSDQSLFLESIVLGQSWLEIIRTSIADLIKSTSDNQFVDVLSLLPDGINNNDMKSLWSQGNSFIPAEMLQEFEVYVRYAVACKFLKSVSENCIKPKINEMTSVLLQTDKQHSKKVPENRSVISVAMLEEWIKSKYPRIPDTLINLMAVRVYPLAKDLHTESLSRTFISTALEQRELTNEEQLQTTWCKLYLVIQGIHVVPDNESLCHKLAKHVAKTLAHPFLMQLLYFLLNLPYTKHDDTNPSDIKKQAELLHALPGELQKTMVIAFEYCHKRDLKALMETLLGLQSNLISFTIPNQEQAKETFTKLKSGHSNSPKWIQLNQLYMDRHECLIDGPSKLLDQLWDHWFK